MAKAAVIKGNGGLVAVHGVAMMGELVHGAISIGETVVRGIDERATIRERAFAKTTVMAARNRDACVVADALTANIGSLDDASKQILCQGLVGVLVPA